MRFSLAARPGSWSATPAAGEQVVRPPTPGRGRGVLACVWSRDLVNSGVIANVGSGPLCGGGGMNTGHQDRLGRLWLAVLGVLWLGATAGESRGQDAPDLDAVRQAWRAREKAYTE